MLFTASRISYTFLQINWYISFFNWLHNILQNDFITIFFIIFQLTGICFISIFLPYKTCCTNTRAHIFLYTGAFTSMETFSVKDQRANINILGFVGFMWSLLHIPLPFLNSPVKMQKPFLAHSPKPYKNRPQDRVACQPRFANPWNRVRGMRFLPKCIIIFAVFVNGIFFYFLR